MYILYLFLHADVLDLKTALLIKTHRIIILGLDLQLQITAPECSGQRMDILHHSLANSVTLTGLMDHKFNNLHNLPADDARSFKIML